MDGLKLMEFEPGSELMLPGREVGRARFPAVDFHTHFGLYPGGRGYEAGAEAERLREMGLRAVVNLDGFWGARLDGMLKHTQGHEDFYITFAGVDVSRIGEAGFEREAERSIRRAAGLGVRGLKFFKDMSLIGPNRIMPDDERLKVVWECAAREGLVILIHIADPTAFFKPVDRFNERYEELSRHPDWSFCGPGFPSFEELMQAQENMLGGNPDTMFVIAHVGSHAENLARVGRWLDKYPNMYVDTAARVAELGRQPYTARKFLTEYQDRVLFGTDYFPGADGWPVDFRFYETMDEYFPYDRRGLPQQGRWNIYGVGLEDEVLRKMYAGNAMRILRIA